MKKYLKINSWFLGVSMFMFGVLKFVNPFKEWYTVQIESSGLGSLSYGLGIAGEIAVGTSLILVMLNFEKLNAPLKIKIINATSIVIIVMMCVGIFVHLHPKVPASVLPLKIKPPYIPGFFLFLAAFNIFKAYKIKTVAQKQ